MIFPNEIVKIPAPMLTQRQLIRRCEQKFNAIFFCVTAEIFRTVFVGVTRIFVSVPRFWGAVWAPAPADSLRNRTPGAIDRPDIFYTGRKKARRG